MNTAMLISTAQKEQQLSSETAGKRQLHKRYRPSDRRLSTKLVPTFANRSLIKSHTPNITQEESLPVTVIKSSIHTMRSSPTTNLPQLSATENCLVNELQSLL
jgi:hypothetical protein